MKNLEIFDFNESPVRVVLEAGSPWWVAADVCRCLGLDQVTAALRALDEDERMTLANSKGHSGQRGGAQSFNVVSESGLYSLIFKSRKPAAKAFKRWVTHEVLPAIRRTGGYAVTAAAPALADVARASVLGFVKSSAPDLSLVEVNRFARMARSTARAQGVAVTPEANPDFGDLAVYPSALLSLVMEAMRKERSIVSESEAADVRRLFSGLSRNTRLSFAQILLACQRLGLFEPGGDGSDSAQLSKVGLFLKRWAGRKVALPDSAVVSLQISGRARHRRYTLVEVAK